MSTAALDITSIVINGQDRRHYAQLIDAVTADNGGVKITETVNGASTVTMTLMDPDRVLLRSELFSTRSTIVLDEAGWELAAVKWAGGVGRLTATFEDIAVARLRRCTGTRKARAGTVTRAEFIARLIRAEEPWIDVHAATGSSAQVELARGSGSDDGQEDTWTAGQRILGEIGWRMYARRGEIYLGPDSWTLARAARYALDEDTPGVDVIDLDYDVGKPAASATLTVQAAAHTLPAGARVDLARLGPGAGTWLVESTERTAASRLATVTLIRSAPTLPEPREETDSGGEDGEVGYRTGTAGGAAVGRHPAAESETIASFVAAALSKQGCAYRWGKSGPDIFDCSGLVQWASAQVGHRLAKPASDQWAACLAAGTSMSVEQGIGTYGALLFKIVGGNRNHVAISLGNGKTIEAMGRAYGVRVGNARGRGFNHAGYAPGMRLARSLSEYLTHR